MKTAVVKCGGSVIGELSDSFFQSMKEMMKNGYRIVFVHGGGPEINSMLEKLHVKSEFKDGLRVTSKEVLDIAELVLAGSTNRKLVRMLQSHGIEAIGINSSDHRILQADFINQDELGYVGDVTSVHQEFIQNLCEQGVLPVLTPIGLGPNHTILNVNADHAASAIAKALQADRFLMVTDVDGVLHKGELLSTLTEKEANSFIKEGVINGGMIPKVTSALNAFSEYVNHVHIVSGKKSFYNAGKWYGTELTKEKVTV
ncbi:acetylglutamate kinase [Oikeobacillus pervagus]|uniref:Acetylglutamate kinase n=1 Tax=Oikeobacillus pervagus TaxID=1325931 RepID=A0AAJ1WJL2_9BACI|nr:acetylglutamate kinase [Oikeobacillus pervagus]MDQ0215790.1 acetylglutamate kinase [Oikeobacillus pervagus]